MLPWAGPGFPQGFHGAYLAYQGQYFEIPIITDFLRNQGWIE